MEEVMCRELTESVLCVPGSRIVTSSSTSAESADDVVLFINAGGEGDDEHGVQNDDFYQGGDTIRTDEFIENSGGFKTVYQAARFGNCGYRFDAMAAGNYLVDFFFAEIVNTNGPRGMRVFNVYIQEEKVINELDVYSIVGANKPLRVVDIKVPVGEDGSVAIRFEGVVGTPIVNGICIRKASDFSTRLPADNDSLKCTQCSAELMIAHKQAIIPRTRNLVKYEEQIKELKLQCQRKADECHEAWMSLTSATHELEKVRMELDKSFFRNMTLDKTMKEQTDNLRIIEGRYKRERRVWETSFVELEKKAKLLKQNHVELAFEARECARAIPDMDKMIVAIQNLVAQYEDLKLKFNEEQMKRKDLHNQLQEAKGNIRVFCRCRPMCKEEQSAGYQTVIDFSAAKDGDLEVLTNRSTKKLFKFDRVFTPEDDQATVYLDASPVVMSVLDGYNACIFAYGQTGTGKTFTMEGSESNRGVNYRTLQQLFKIIEDRKETAAYDISVSVLEVYNEQIRDLLATSTTAKLEVKQRSEGLSHVPGVVEARVGNVKEAWEVLQVGSNARVVGSNNVNERSSRSHCLLCTFVRTKNLISGECTMSKLWLVDLAGSERLTKTEVQGERLKEAQNINRSLSALGDVISALASKSSHVPYRNSKLTHLLQDSLGGDSKTLMFVQISPSENDLGETISSLNFATRVRGVELGPVRKQTDNGELQKTKTMLDKARQELRNKDEITQRLESQMQILVNKANSKDQLFKNQNDKVNELEKQLASKGESCRNLEMLVAQLSAEGKEKEKACLQYQHEIKQLEIRLKESAQISTTNLQSQVKDYEEKVKQKTLEIEERMKEKMTEYDSRMREMILKHEYHTRTLEQQIEDLEKELAKEKLNGEDHQRKLIIYEAKVKQHHEQGEASASKAGARTPHETENPLSQRNLNSSVVRASSAHSLRGNELRAKRMKSENSFQPPAFSSEKAAAGEEASKSRQIGASKRAFARIAKPVQSHKTQPPHGIYAAKDGQNTGTKEENKKQKMWLR